MAQKVALFRIQACNLVSSFQKFGSSKQCKHFCCYIGVTIFLIRVLLAANKPAIATVGIRFDVHLSVVS
jgi:hypothetical protein